MRYEEIKGYSWGEVSHMVEELGIPLAVLKKEEKIGVKRRVIDGALEVKCGELTFHIALNLQRGFGFNIEYGLPKITPLKPDQLEQLYNDLHSNRKLPGIINFP